MEIQFDDEPKKGRTPGTRVYAPADAASGEPTRRKRRTAAAPEVETVVDEDGFRIRVPTDEIRPASRIGLIICAFVLAGMILFMLTGYEKISRAYADINTLTDEIELTELRIAELDVSIECAVTIAQAQEAAQNAGMTYPTQSQYVRIGSAIPTASASLAGSAPADGAGAANTADAANGDATQPEDDVTFDPNGLPVETGN